MSHYEEHYERDFDALGSLPGGSINYLTLIEEVLRDLHSRTQPTIVDVERALSKDRVIASRSMEDYLQLLQRMSLLVRHHDESVTLTPLALALLQADSAEERARLMVEMLLRHCGGMVEVLALYENAPRALALNDVQAALLTYFPNWKLATTNNASCGSWPQVSEEDRYSLLQHQRVWAQRFPQLCSQTATAGADRSAERE